MNSHNLEESLASVNSKMSGASAASGVSRASNITKDDLLSQLDEEMNNDEQLLR